MTHSFIDVQMYFIHEFFWSLL